CPPPVSLDRTAGHGARWLQPGGTSRSPATSPFSALVAALPVIILLGLPILVKAKAPRRWPVWHRLPGRAAGVRDARPHVGGWDARCEVAGGWCCGAGGRTMAGGDRVAGGCRC